MDWLEISVPVIHTATEAVADIFMEIGAGGVTIADPREVNFHLASGQWDCTDLTAEPDNGLSLLTAYLPRDGRLPDRLAALDGALTLLNDRLPGAVGGDVAQRQVREEDWAGAWKQYFHTARLGRRIVIKPSWEDYKALPDDLIVELDPGMAFGTGTHHTTALCLEKLEDLVKPGQTVFDLGTGSGVLAMAAARLGARVVAVDLDPVAVKIARENVLLNGLAARVDVRAGDLLIGMTGRADIIVANIVADVIGRLLPDIPDKLNAGGLFIASGIIIGRRADMERQTAAAGLNILEIRERGEWALITAQKP